MQGAELTFCPPGKWLVNVEIYQPIKRLPFVAFLAGGWSKYTYILLAVGLWLVLYLCPGDGFTVPERRDFVITHLYLWLAWLLLINIYINILSNVNVLSSRGLTLKHSLLFYILWIVSVLTSRVHKQLAFFLAVRSSVSSLLVPWALFAALWINVYWMKPNEVHDLLLSAIPCFFWPVLDELCDTQEKRTERQTHPLAVGNESSLAGLFLHLHTNFVLKWSYDLFFRHWYMSSRIW